jgi:cyclophilin family peptidyl-prolyl cis-trans isomerase
MSNKTLVIVIIIILAVGAGLAGFFYWQNTKPLRMDTPAPVSEDQAPPSLLDTSSTTPSNVPSSTPPSTATSTPVASNSGQCTPDFSQSKLTSNANMNISNREVQINVKDFGNITLAFYDKDAPLAVENFLRLTDAGYYDCVTFHRIAAGFVIQGGDPTGTGSGGQSAFGQSFKDELNADTQSYKTGYVKGVLAMANSGPNTNGSQFFILLGDQTSWMPHSYTIFGHVISGQDVVDKIGQLQTNPAGDGKPLTPVVMESVKIIK